MVVPDGGVAMLVLGGQEWHRLQFRCEMAMSRKRWTRAGSPGSGFQHLAPRPLSEQQCCARWAGSLLFSSPRSRASRGPGTHPQQNWALLGQELQQDGSGDRPSQRDVSPFPS